MKNDERFWDWLSKGFDGLASMMEGQAHVAEQLPERTLVSLMKSHTRFLHVINSELHKRGRPPIGGGDYT